MTVMQTFFFFSFWFDGNDKWTTGTRSVQLSMEMITYLHILYKSLFVSAIAACVKKVSETVLASVICVWCHPLTDSLWNTGYCVYMGDCLWRFCCIWSLWKLQMWYRLECVAMTCGKKVPDSQSPTGSQSPAGDSLIP